MRQSLARRYLLRQIREFRQIRTQANVMSFSVLTKSGPLRFELDRPRESYQAFGPNGLLLCDVQGNYYVIPDRTALPRPQRRLLALYSPTRDQPSLGRIGPVGGDEHEMEDSQPMNVNNTSATTTVRRASKPEPGLRGVQRSGSLATGEASGCQRQRPA